MYIHFDSESLYVFSVDIFNHAIHLDQYIHNDQVYLKAHSKISMKQMCQCFLKHEDSFFNNFL